MNNIYQQKYFEDRVRRHQLSHKIIISINSSSISMIIILLEQYCYVFSLYIKFIFNYLFLVDEPFGILPVSAYYFCMI